MKEFLTKYSVQIVGVILILAGIVWLRNRKSNYTGIDGLARCLKDKGAKFYGASWCGVCNNQKKMFDNSANLLPYVECSNPDRSPKRECADAKITAYPTWVFPGGKRHTGALTIEQLREAVKC